MMSSTFEFTVFTKPWKEQPLPELAQHLKGLGFDGVELTVRPGYQVDPEAIETGLPEAARMLGDHGLKILSIAGPYDEPALAACAEAGVPVVRVCAQIPNDMDYFAGVSRLQREWDEVVPLLEKYGVTLGLQNHCNRCVPHALGMYHAISKYDPKHIAAVWDPAHCAVDGEIPELALDIVWSHLCMVNLKNAIWRNTAGPEAEVAEWKSYWTSGRYGLCDWRKVAALLKERDWSGTVCLTAEYSDHDSVERLIADDIAYAKKCLGVG